MGIEKDPNVSIKDEDIEPGSVTTDSLVDNDDGQAWETLREAGYEIGDPVGSLSVGGQNGSESITNGTYTSVLIDNIQLRHRWDFSFPSGVTVEVFGQANVDPGSTTMDVRLQNITDSETVVETTGISSFNSDRDLGPVQYEPTTTDDGITYELQTLSGDGSTSVTIRDPYFEFHPKL